MDEQKLVKLLKEHFPSKEDFSSLKKEVGSLGQGQTSLKQEFLILKQDMTKGFNDVNVSLKVLGNHIEELRADIDEMKPSAKSLDILLEQHPTERIDRLEKHVSLPPFVGSIAEDEG